MGVFFPGGSEVKAYACNAGDLDLIPGLERSPGKGNGNPLQYPCPANPTDRRSLVGYSPWGRKSRTHDLTTKPHIYFNYFAVLSYFIAPCHVGS